MYILRRVYIVKGVGARLDLNCDVLCESTIAANELTVIAKYFIGYTLRKVRSRAWRKGLSRSMILLGRNRLCALDI